MRWYVGLLLVLALIVPQSLMAAGPQSRDRGRDRDRYRPMRITEQTRSTTIRTDSATKSVELKVSVSGGSRPYTYTWYEGPVGDTSVEIGYRNRMRLTLSYGTYDYWAEVQDSLGEVVTSRAISITIEPRTVGPLEIRKQPRSQEVESSGAITSVDLEVNAVGGTRPYTYTWYEGESGDTSLMIDEGEEIMVDLEPGDYAFWAQVTDDNGDTVDSDTAYVSVISYPLTIVDQTLDQTITAYGDTEEVELQVEVDGGMEPYSYTWYQGELGDTSTIVGTDSEITLDLTPDIYTFWAEVIDDNGDTVTSEPIVVDVASAPLEIARQPRNTTATWRSGTARTTLTVEARGGTAPLTYEWFLEGVSVGTGASLPVEFTDATEAPRDYSVVVTDAIGDSVTSRTATVRISLPPFGITSYTRNTTARWVGGQAIATVSVRIRGGIGPFTYTWYEGTRRTSGSIVATGTLVNGYAVARFDTGATAYGRKVFFVTVTDAAGNVKYAQSYTTVRIPRPPVLPTSTPVPTVAPSTTPEPTATDTVVPTATDTVVPTATDTVVPTATDTVVPTATP